jgi:signal transduction histidine kinase/DNA-binding response OmpR family regulator
MDSHRIEVLLVEDNPGDARLIQEYLKDQTREQFRITRVARLSEALAGVDHARFAVILLDLHLPDSHGIETLQKLSTVARSIPIIVMTGLDDRDLALEAVHEGAQDYLVKGQVDSEAITRAILHAIDRQQLQVDLMQQAAALRESESMFRRVIEASADGIVIVDAGDTVRLANSAAAELFGKTPEDMIGLPFGVESDSGRLVERELPTGRVVELGSVPTEWLGTPAKLVSMRETTERRRRLEQQAALSTLAQLALKQPDPEAFRTKAVALVEKTLRAEACAIVEKVEDGRWSLTADILGDESRIGVLAIRAAPSRPFTDDDRHFLDGAARVLAESARRHRAAAHQRALEDQVRHAQKMESLGVLAGGIAHDFNNLLMAIVGHASLGLAEVDGASAVRDHLSQIEATAKRAADLTNQLLAYAGKGRFVIERVNLNRLVEEMGNLLHTAISRKASIRYDLAPDLPAVEGDPTQLNQVVMNLITNASEALGGEAGTITVTTGRMQASEKLLREACFENSLTAGSYVFLEVSDTGCGMDEVTLQKIFDPFFSTKFAGRGLGLASVLGVIRSHHGAIRVTSAKGVGTRFRILFPFVAEPAHDAPQAPRPEVRWKGAGTILLVDDEDLVRAVAELMLRRLGFEVITACDGLEAVDVFRTRKDQVDAVVLDMTMPNMDGNEALAALQKLKPDVRVLMTSGFTAEDVAGGIGRNGRVSFLQKPFNSAMLAEKMQALFPTRRARETGDPI